MGAFILFKKIWFPPGPARGCAQPIQENLFLWDLGLVDV